MPHSSGSWPRQRSRALPFIEAGHPSSPPNAAPSPQRSRALPFIEATAAPTTPSPARTRSALGRCPSSRREMHAVSARRDIRPQRSRALPFIEASGMAAVTAGPTPQRSWALPFIEATCVTFSTVSSPRSAPGPCPSSRPEIDGCEIDQAQPAALPGAALHRGCDECKRPRTGGSCSAPGRCPSSRQAGHGRDGRHLIPRSAPGRCPSSRRRQSRRQRQAVQQPAALPGDPLHRGVICGAVRSADTSPQRSRALPFIEAGNGGPGKGAPPTPQRARALPFIEAGGLGPRQDASPSARSAPGRCPSSRLLSRLRRGRPVLPPQRFQALPFIEAGPRKVPRTRTRSRSASGRCPSSRRGDADGHLGDADPQRSRALPFIEAGRLQPGRRGRA